jgi:dGTP triphosphohydrolase
MLEFKYGVFVDNRKEIIETDAPENVFMEVCELVEKHSLKKYNFVMRVKDVLKSLGYEAEDLDDSTNANYFLAKKEEPTPKVKPVKHEKKLKKRALIEEEEEEQQINTEWANDR